MNHIENEQQQRDEQLWRIAKKRAAFKASFATYLFVNAGLIVIWYFTSGRGSYFWPIWPLLGWGLGMAAQYVSAYHSLRLFSAEEEYKKLKSEHS